MRMAVLISRLSKPEQVAVELFHRLCDPLQVDPLHAIWYTREHQLDAPKAAKAYLATVAWRRAVRDSNPKPSSPLSGHRHSTLHSERLGVRTPPATAPLHEWTTSCCNRPHPPQNSTLPSTSSSRCALTLTLTLTMTLTLKY